MTDLLKYLPEFIEDLESQLKADDKRWGKTWKKRDKEGQVERLKPWINDMCDRLEYGNLTTTEKQMEYLKLVGNAYINWVREKYPEGYREEFLE